MDKINLATVRQSFAQTVFTHQVQEAACNRRNNDVRKYKIINIVLVASVLGILSFQSINGPNTFLTYMGASITFVEVVFLFIQLTFNVEQQAIAHKNSALKYMSVRDKYRALISDIMSAELGDQTIRARRDSLQEEYQSISDLSPQTESVDYDLAQLRLGLLAKDEQFTWSDKEIDRFLPEELRISRKSK